MAARPRRPKRFNKLLGEPDRRELTDEEAEQADRRFEGVVPQTDVQRRASQQGVPLEAFRQQNESKEQFTQRATQDGSVNEAARRELIEQKRIELETALLNATPASQTQTTQGQTGQTQDNQLQQTKPSQGQSSTQSSSINQANEAFKRTGEVIKRAAALNPLTVGIPPLDEARQRGFEDVKEVIPQALGVTSQIVDIVRTAISGKSSKQLTAAEEVMNTYMSALGEDVQLYKQGLKSFEDVAQNIKQAEASISQYESNLVFEGRRNLNFWIDKGARIEANVIAQRDKIEDFKRVLINAGSQNI